jgi:N-acetylglutamate synthase-like GNAT family acetyltransferase
MIKIRLAKHNEINILNDLIAESTKKLGRDDYSALQLKSAIQYMFRVDTQLIHDQTYFVIEKDGEIAGCGGWSKRKTMFSGNQSPDKAEENLLDPAKDAAKIRIFFIHPKFARQGLGTILLRHCEQEASKNKFTQFEMMATFTGMNLYKTLDYKEVSNKYVTLPDRVSLPFVHMRKNLRELKPINTTSTLGLFTPSVPPKKEPKEAEAKQLKSKL